MEKELIEKILNKTLEKVPEDHTLIYSRYKDQIWELAKVAELWSAEEISHSRMRELIGIYFLEKEQELEKLFLEREKASLLQWSRHASRIQEINSELEKLK